MESSSQNPPLEERCRRLENQITTMKQISSLRKNLLELREKQAKSLISKLKYYEVIVAEERESRHSLSSRLQSAELQCGQLTERLKQNAHTIDEMKSNYENKVTTLINELQTSEQRNQQLSDQMSKECSFEELAKRLEEKEKLISDMQRQMKKVWDRNKVMSYQMTLLNNLFNETEGVTIDFERIKAIGDIVRDNQTFADELEDELSDDQDAEMRQSADLEHLLDSMEKSEDVIPAEIPGEESCYKCVDTKKGPQLVLSVSRTFIKLKDLIVEKKSLQKEIDTLKALNTKLESKVDKQEHRLYRVTLELNKTWSLVSKLKQQHKRLYNSEAVLRYELQEKRTLLERLKTELSLSRDKWKRVRQKNSQSQIEWEKLRDEFAERRNQSSQESGTFSEAMSVSSSGENDVTVEDEVVDEVATLVAVNSSRRGSQSESIRKLSLPSNSQVSSVPPVEQSELGQEEADEVHPGEEDFEDGARALSPLEDEHFVDPLEELVSNLVEDIDNEADADTEEDVNGNTSRAPVPTEITDSSPSPDFEDRMRRRANRLRMLEEQCVMLHQKIHASTARGEALSTKLAELHDHYGPSDSSTGTTGGEHDDQQQNDVSNVNKEATETNQTVSIAVTDEDTTSISTDAAYVSGTENNASDGSGNCEETKPEIDTQPTTLLPAENAENVSNSNGSSSPCQESSTSRTTELINVSENSHYEEAEQTKDTRENNTTETQESLQGQSEDIGTKARSEIACAEEVSAVGLSDDGKCNVDCDCDHSGSSDMKATTTTEEATTCTTLPHAQTFLLESTLSQNVESEESRDNNAGHNFNDNEPFVTVTDHNDATEQPEETHLLQPQLTIPEIQEVSPLQEAEVLPSEEEEPLPIIQETVVQHFPSTSEEEANEFAPVQIRPEFLRILQEADEATNANSLDWMPSLLTITHSVALLRLDPELPSATSSGSDGAAISSSANNNNNTSRSLSESLRIEIPPSPPLHPIRQNDNVRRMNHNGRDIQPDEQPSSVEVEGCGEDERLSVLRKDPGFLSRMIIKQLPKRLQLLKNENHTLQMEAAETNMRMKEMKRQLNREVDKQQQLSISLDAQIEDKNLIEFELREEMEKKEKVIEELQMEIDESKDYIDELKKEKDEVDAYFKALLEEKLDMEEPKVAADSVTNCHNCKRAFSLLTRRKCHCDICGKVYCKDCAIPREPNRRSPKRPRLCTRCHLRRQRLVALVSASKKSPSEETS